MRVTGVVLIAALVAIGLFALDREVLYWPVIVLACVIGATLIAAALLVSLVRRRG